MVPICYSPNYDITAFGLERLHPFDSIKYGRIARWLVQQGLRCAKDFRKPRPSTRRELLRVHSEAYLDSLRQRQVVARILEVRQVAYLPAWVTNWRVLRPMRWATGGTILACQLALQCGLAINIGGGYHHAGPDYGGGFCVYADVPLALATLHDQGLLRSALIVDTDAHQGNGTADSIKDWSWAHILDFYEENIYPWPKMPEPLGVPLSPRTNGAEYMDRLRDHLPRALDSVKPDLLIYNAGSDVLWSDPLAQLFLTADDMADRDLYVITEARQQGVAVAMVLSGGYGQASWIAHARSIEGILARFDKMS
jgi:histone deacetylase 11